MCAAFGPAHLIPRFQLYQFSATDNSISITPRDPYVYSRASYSPKLKTPHVQSLFQLLTKNATNVVLREQAKTLSESLMCLVQLEFPPVNNRLNFIVPVQKI